jgi:thiol-disulfide isomerase/thioredoxin
MPDRLSRTMGMSRRQTQRGLGAALVSALGCALAPFGRAASGTRSQDSPPDFRGSHGFVALTPGRSAPAVPMRRLDGAVTNLGKFRGRAVLLNFWASWCAPCVAELPRLDRLAAAMAGEPVEVAAVSMDREGEAVVASFVQRLGLRRLVPYLDPAERIGHFRVDNPNGAAFALYRMPISYLVDTAGIIRGYVPGAALWDTDDAKRLLRHFMR